MNVLIAADIFPPQSGGPATYCVTLANELVKQGIGVIIISHNPDSDRKALDEGVRLYSVCSRNRIIRYAHYFWLLYWQAKKADIIYAMGPVNAGWPASVVARWIKKRFVVKVVGDYAWEQGQVLRLVKDSIDEFQKKNYGGKIGRLKKREHDVARRADAVIVPSEFLKKIVLGWGVKPEKIEVIYNAVEFMAVDPIKHDGERWLVSVGRLVPWKGFAALIEIMPEMLKEFPDLKLKIIGNGPEMQNYKLQITNYKLNDNVELLGELSHDKTLSYIHSADVCVLNSDYEGLSHVILEALSFGRPVLASNIGGNPEIVIPGKTGDLFEYNNKGEIKNKISSFLKIGIVHNEMLRLDGRIDFFGQFETKTMISRTRDTLSSLSEKQYNNITI